MTGQSPNTAMDFDTRLRVLITVDTELSVGDHKRGMAGAENHARAIDGSVTDGAYGIGYQARFLAERELRGVFFIDPFMVPAIGDAGLRQSVATLLAEGQDIQLHAHPEWLRFYEPAWLDGRRGTQIADFSFEDQCTLLSSGKDLLEAAGAPQLSAFRAGNYGADDNTLRALAVNGISFDSSLNHAYRGAPCAIEAPRTAHAPFAHHGVCEMPIASFEDYPGHIRHAQLCACSAEEMIAMLKAARRAGWRYFIIVSHSFELLNRARTRANRIQLKRFERLCGFLEQHNDEYVTCGFDELDPDEVITNAGVNAPLSSRIDRTARRMAAQAVGHILYERG